MSKSDLLFKREEKFPSLNQGLASEKKLNVANISAILFHIYITILHYITYPFLIMFNQMQTELLE